MKSTTMALLTGWPSQRYAGVHTVPRTGVLRRAPTKGG
jgi:hypothetical protein